MNNHTTTELMRQAVSDFMAKKDRYVQKTLKDHDWETYPILDFVWVKEPHYELGRTDPADRKLSERVMTVPHTHPAPPIEDSAIHGERCEVQRVTRPLWEKIEREYL